MLLPLWEGRMVDEAVKTARYVTEGSSWSVYCLILDRVLARSFSK